MSLVRTTQMGFVESLDAVRVYLKEVGMWLTVTAAKGTNARFPNNIAIGCIKKELCLMASTYEGKIVHIYDATDSFSEDTVISGGYEYLDDYVVAPGVKLYASINQQSVAGVHSNDDEPKEHEKVWDGLTWVQIVDENRWTQVMLPNNLPDGKLVTANMLKRSVLALLNKSPTPSTVAGMRVLRNDTGVAAGLPYKGTDRVCLTSWYTVAVSPTTPLLVMQSGADIPSPDNSSDVKDWEDVGDQYEYDHPQ